MGVRLLAVEIGDGVLLDLGQRSRAPERGEGDDLVGACSLTSWRGDARRRACSRRHRGCVEDGVRRSASRWYGWLRLALLLLDLLEDSENGRFQVWDLHTAKKKKIKES